MTRGDQTDLLLSGVPDVVLGAVAVLDRGAVPARLAGPLLAVSVDPRLDEGVRAEARALLERRLPGARPVLAGLPDVVDRLRADHGLEVRALLDAAVPPGADVDGVELAVALLVVHAHEGARGLGLQRLELAEAPEALSRLAHLTYLDADDNGWTQVPGSVLAMTRLTHLSLARNRLATLPYGLSGWRELATLDLDRNPFEGFPEPVTRVRSLRRLRLAAPVEGTGPRWGSLPESVGELSELRELALDGQDLDSLPVGLRSTRLARLSLRGCRLHEVPGWLAEKRSLREVDLHLAVVADASGAAAVVDRLRGRGVTVLGR